MAVLLKSTAGVVNTFWQTFLCMQSARSHWAILSRSIGLRKPKRGLMHSVAGPNTHGVGPKEREKRKERPNNDSGCQPRPFESVQ